MKNNYTKSNELLKRALKVTPLGAQTFSKCFRYHCSGNAPLYLEKGKGCYVWDVDGNRFIDFICALGPVTVGYNDERVNQAVIKQLENGVSFSQETEISVELAEKLVEILPCAEMVRIVKNGSDATTAAVRLARAYTERDMILQCGYHGMHDWSICTTANDAGIPKKISEMTKIFKYNDPESLKEMFAKYAGQVAAVIMEPIQGNGPKDGYLQEVKRITHENGAVLIFDEVVSGFRYALGGASELYGVVPDLASYGKGMANGLAISAIAGRRDILNQIAEKAVFISTTFGGETLSMAAALATIKILQQPGVFENFRRLGNRLAEGYQKLIDQKGLGAVVKVAGVAPHGGVSFSGAKSLDYLDITSVFQQVMSDNGILTYGMVNLNTSHTDKEIDLYLAAADKALDAIANAVEQDSTEGIVLGGKISPVFRRNIQ